MSEAYSHRTVRIRLHDGRDLILAKGNGWKDKYLDALIIPFLAGTAVAGSERVASSKNVRVWKTRTDEGPVAVKLFDARGLRDRLPFRKSRAARAFKGDMLLSASGFFVPPLVAEGEIKEWGRTTDSFIITEWLEGCVNVITYLDSIMKMDHPRDRIMKKRKFLRRFGGIIGKMHKASLFHGDLRLGNVLVREDSDNLDFYFLDNERTKLFPHGIPDRLRMKNLVQINMIDMPGLTSADRFRFFRAYLEENPECARRSGELALKIFRRTRERLSEKYPGIWQSRLR